MKLILFVLIAASLAFGQKARKIAPSKPVKSTPIAKSSTKATAAKSTPIRPTSKFKTSFRSQPTKSTRVTATRTRKTVARPTRSYVQSPPPERYREIQQALADKGYYKSEVTGSWDNTSIEALNRFKTDQKLRADGKLCSLSLIALGLGPKYEAIDVDQLPTPPVSTDQR